MSDHGTAEVEQGAFLKNAQALTGTDPRSLELTPEEWAELIRS